MRRARLLAAALAMIATTGAARADGSIYDTIVYLPTYIMPIWLRDFGWDYPPTGVAVVPGSSPAAFQIVVRPNIMTYAQAVPFAARYAQDYCRAAGRTGTVRITGSRPYARADLAARSFDGRCG